jgi:glycosyltransferase involved in cell wall biosynthesis
MENIPTAPRLKIALVSDWYYPRVGGVEYAINALARHLIALGHEVHIITKKIKGTSAHEQLNNLLIIRLESNSISEHLITKKAYQSLQKELILGNYDIVHAHGIDSPMALTSLLISRRNNIKSVLTNHSQIGKDILKFPKTLILNVFLKYASAMIAVSDVVHQENKQLFNGPLYVIPNGIDNNSPNGELFLQPIKEGKIVITTTARMVKRKGVAEFVDMALELLKTNDNLLFILIGGGPLKNKLEQMVTKSGAAHHFLFAGQSSRATVLDILDRTDIFVSTSRQEAFGIAVLEAFYKKIPVIARQGTGAAELVDHQQTGFLAESTKDFITWVAELIKNPALRKSIATTAYNELPKYQWQTIAKSTESLYMELIHKNGLQRV